jgi:hypothetical protein
LSDRTPAPRGTAAPVTAAPVPPIAALALAVIAALALTLASLLAFVPDAGARLARTGVRRHSVRARIALHSVLLVGQYNGKPGQYSTVQEAVDAAKPGDWILIGPGDYKQTSARHPSGAYGDDQAASSILVTTPNLHIRGMNRNTVVIDGTKPGSPQCSAAEGDQTFGPAEGGGWQGNNGITVYKASGVVLQNFTACNFLGYNHGGDAIWFDGGGASGKQEIGYWYGSYLSATSTYWGGHEKPAGMYGIYASNTYGPGTFIQDYASNMADSGYYIGACPDCHTTLNHVRSEGNDLGYSGTNSGGRLVIENSEFNNNEEGVATTSQNNDDAPPPQDGECPGGKTNPNAPSVAQRKDICWVFIHNKVLYNNNGATPTSPSAPGLVGTGMTAAGSRNDLIVENTFAGNRAWGLLLIPFPAQETPPPQVPESDHCRGGVGTGSGESYVCYFDDFANEVANNKFINNGAFGNPTNGDIGEVSNPETNGNCWHGNTGPNGSTPSSTPAEIQKTHGTCGTPNAGEPPGSVLAAQAACDSQLVASCPEAPGAKYPRSSTVKLFPLPKEPTMGNPCAGVPANPWCQATATAARATGASARRRG